MPALDAALLNLAASLLVVFVGALLWASERKLPLWWFGTYAIAFLVVAVGVLFALGVSTKPEVFAFGAAALLGINIGAVLGDEGRSSWRVHKVALPAALAFDGVLIEAATHYRWWVAPLAILGLIAVGLVANYLVPGVRGLLGRPRPAEASGGTAGGPAPPPPVLVNPHADEIHLVCHGCKYASWVPAALGGRKVQCHRCGRVDTVPRRFPKPAGPVDGTTRRK